MRLLCPDLIVTDLSMPVLGMSESEPSPTVGGQDASAPGAPIYCQSAPSNTVETAGRRCTSLCSEHIERC